MNKNHKESIARLRKRVRGEADKEGTPKKDEERCPFPGCNGVKGHVECPTCGQEHCDGCF